LVFQEFHQGLPQKIIRRVTAHQVVVITPLDVGKEIPNNPIPDASVTPKRVHVLHRERGSVIPAVSDLSKQFKKSFKNTYLCWKNSSTTPAVYIPCLEPTLNTPNLVANTAPKLLMQMGILIQRRVYGVCDHNRICLIFSEAGLAQVVA
jgi:hypothetical protein